MNASFLHDALTLLPEDLIAETDALRQAKKPRIIPWKKVLPMAACLCLILLTAPTMIALLSPKGAKEMAMDYAAPAEAAPAPAAAEKEAAMDQFKMEDAPAETLSPKVGAAMNDGSQEDRGLTPQIGAAYGLTAHYLPTQLCDAGIGQRITVISNRSELDDYLAQYSSLYSDDALVTACEAYDDDYFADNQLVILLTAEYLPTASYSGNVLLPIQSGNWFVNRDGENGWVIGVGDMVHDLSTAQQHILLELPHQLIAPGDSITLVQTPKED